MSLFRSSVMANATMILRTVTSKFTPPLWTSVNSTSFRDRYREALIEEAVFLGFTARSNRAVSP
ncbi:hypothetical protein ACVWZ6_008116 [Bradyrhizobium sp. GM6.1]